MEKTVVAKEISEPKSMEKIMVPKPISRLA